MIKHAVIRIEDEVNIAMTGLDLAARKACVNAVKYFIPGARYSAAYRLGRWDGTKSFATLGGRTYLNLLDRMLPILQEHGYDFEIADNRLRYELSLNTVTDQAHAHKVWPKGHERAGQQILLRDYQVDVINTFVENLQAVQQVATGAGKTLITATLSGLIEPYGRSIVIVPNKSLVEQTEIDYRNLGLDVGVLYGDRKEYDRTHTICTWQSLNVLDKKSKDALDDHQHEIFMRDLMGIIVDECFDGDELVLTPTGYLPIKDIKPGDEVINYSEKENQFKVDVVVKQHLNLMKSKSEQMFELEFDNGRKIKVTGNHKFLTNLGWCRADNLTEDHEITNYGINTSS